MCELRIPALDNSYTPRNSIGGTLTSCITALLAAMKLPPGPIAKLVDLPFGCVNFTGSAVLEEGSS